MQRLLLILGCLALLVNGIINTSKYNAFKKEDGSYVFIRQGEALNIPDEESLVILGFKKEEIKTIPNDVLAVMKKGEPIPSLKRADPWADEQMRSKIETILAYNPAHYWTESHYLVGHGNQMRSYNPGMLKIRKDKILYCWRSTDYDSQVLFGWYDHRNHSITPEPRIKLDNSIVFNGAKSPMQDDGRLILIDKNTIGVTFSGVIDKLIRQMYAIGTYSDETGLVEFKEGSSYMFKYPEHQKNWTPFVYNQKMLFFYSMYPVRVVAASAPAFTNDPANVNVLTVETVSELPADPSLPWDVNLFGKIRGGTPAIMLKGKLFALFHTQFNVVNAFHTYFVGAISYCPEPPFKVHAVSPYPMVRKGLYEGAWSTPKVNYVIYPMGIVVDEKETVMHVSMGYQDKHGYIMTLKVDELLESMEIVNECNTTTTTSSTTRRSLRH